MKRMLALLIVFASFALGACVVDNDTPNLTAVALPEGEFLPVVPPPVDIPAGSVQVGDYDVEGHASRIITAGTDKWERFVSYYVCAGPEEDVLVKRVTIESGTDVGLIMDNADFSSVGVRSYSEILGTGTFSAGTSGKVSIALTKPIWAPKGGACSPMQFVAKIAPVVASSAVSGSWTGVCRSGHAPALGLAKKSVTELDIDVVGATSGKRIVATASDSVHRGKPMVIRKSQPTVSLLPLASTTLANVDLDLLKIQIEADSAGSIAWKQIVLQVAKSKGFSVNNLRLRRGVTDMDKTAYQMTVIDGPWPLDRIQPDTTSCRILFRFGKEEVVTGSGNVYTVHGNIAGVVAGSSISVAFIPSLGTSETGRLTSTSGWGVLLSTKSKDIAPSFLWSDFSEVPHSDWVDIVGSPGWDSKSSYDWINEPLVPGLKGSVTLKL